MVLDTIFGLVVFLAAIAGGFLINKYTPLLKFELTAVAFAVLGAGTVFLLASWEPLVTSLGPYAQGGAMWFRGLASLFGAVVFFLAATLFERNYERIEARMHPPKAGAQSPQELAVVTRIDAFIEAGESIKNDFYEDLRLAHAG